MTIDNFNKKIVLISSALILSNFFLLTISVTELFVKINYVLFLSVIVLYYFKNILDNWYLKIFFLLIIVIALGTPAFEWDARSIWLFHAKRIFYENSILSVSDNYASFSHNDYPTLAPAFASSLASLVGYWNEVFPKISFTLMFFPPLVLAGVFFKDTKYLIFLSIVFFIVGKFLLNGWMDGLVAIYFCLSSLLIYLFFVDDNSEYKKENIFYYIGLFFFISLSLLKNEGIVLLSILFFTSFLISLNEKKIIKNKNFYILMLGSFVPIVLWKIFCYSENLGNDYINENTIIYLTTRLYNLENYKLIFYFLLLNEKFLISLTFFIISFWFKWNKKLFIYVSIISVIYILVLSLIYLSTPYDFYFQLNSSAARLIKVISLLMGFFGLYNLSYKKN